MAILVSTPHEGSLRVEAEAMRPLRFQAGGTLRQGSVYVERSADEDLPRALARGEFCYVLTTRQMGKSSLCVRTMQRLRNQGLACASIDLTSVGSQNSQPADWYYGLMSEIARQLHLEPPDAFWSANENLGPVHGFSRYLEDEILAKVTTRVAIFIDEIDSTLALPFSRDDFFAAIRALYNRRAERPEYERLTFCLLGVAAPGDLIADPARTPFNVGRAIWLEDFTRQEMEGFRGALAALGGTEGHAASKVLDQIFAWTAGHPYMTQRVCEDLSSMPRGQDLDEVVRARFLVRGRIDDSNLQFAEKCFGDRQDERQRDHARRMLHLYSRLLDREVIPADASEPVQLALQLTGMAAARAGAGRMRFLTVRNRIFREVFDAAWVQSMEGERSIAEPLARWLATNHSDDALPSGQALVDLQQWAEGRDDLTPEEQTFLRACIRADARQRETAARQRWQRIVIALMTVAMALLAGLLLSLWRQYRRTQEEAVRVTQAETKAREQAAQIQKALEVEQTANAREAILRSLITDSATVTQSGVHRLLLGLEAVSMAGQVDAALLPMAESALGDAVRGWVENRPLVGHTAPLNVAAFSRDGTRVVTASDDRTARVWTVDGSDAPVVLDGHHGEVTSAAFSPDGTHVVTSSKDGTARVWRTNGNGGAVVLRGHLDTVLIASFSPDGRHVVTASTDGTARVWRVDGSKEPAVLRGHQDMVRSAKFSPDGRHVLTASDDGTVRVWPADGIGEALVLRGHEDRIASASFSPDGARVATVLENAGTVRIWRVDGKGSVVVLRGHEAGVRSVSFSPDGTRVVTASFDETARVWRSDGSGEAVVLRGHEDRVASASFSPDGTRVVTASRDGTARVWQADGSGEAIVLQGHEGSVRSASFSPDGTLVVTSSDDGTARVWRANGRREEVIMRGHEKYLSSASLSPDGTRVVTVPVGWTVQVRHADGSGEPIVLRGHRALVTSASFSPDGKRLVTASNDRTARVWSVDGEREAVVLRGHEGVLRSASFSPDGAHVVTASDDGTARVWPADGSGEVVVLRGHRDVLVSASFSPDGKRVVTASDRTARVWPAHGREDPVVLRGHEDLITSASFSPDGKSVVTASVDNTARVWRADGSGEAVVLRGHQGDIVSASFSPDGTHVVTASSDGTARVWRADGSGDAVVLRDLEIVVGSASFSPDGTRVLTVSRDNSARIWRADGTGDAVVLRGHDDVVLSASFSPDGRHVVTASNDGTVRVWLVDLHPLQQLACAYAGRNLTREEWSSYFPNMIYHKTCKQWP
jgi:WD40 repeat protein